VWGFVFIPLKYLTSPVYTDHPVSPEGFLFLRFVPLLPVLAFLLLRSARREDSRLLARNWPLITLMGLLVVPIYHLPLNFAVRTPLHTGLISLTLNLNPALTYFAAVALGQERARTSRTIGVFVAFLGLAVIIGEEIFREVQSGEAVVFSWAGAGWMLLSVCSWVGYTIIGRRLSADHDPRFIFAATGTVGTLGVLVITPFLIPLGTVLAEARAWTALDWGSWAYMSILSSFLAYWVWIMALSHFEASRLAGLGNFIPLVVHAAAAIFLPLERKAFTPVYLIGAAVTLLGMTLVIRPGRPPAPGMAAAPPPVEVAAGASGERQKQGG
jgi:drug/metabolite transporter (DMT)-like permease